MYMKHSVIEQMKVAARSLKKQEMLMSCVGCPITETAAKAPQV